jgi:hypothetical protein
MAGKNGQIRRVGSAPPAPMSGGIGPRRIVPVPANDNRVPARIRLRRILVAASVAALIAWAAVEILAAAV